MDPMVRLFKSVANETRLRIVERLLPRKEASIEALVSELRLPYKTVARNLKILEKAGVLFERRWKKEVFYSIARPGKSSKGVADSERRAALAVIDVIRRRARRTR